MDYIQALRTTLNHLRQRYPTIQVRKFRDPPEWEAPPGPESGMLWFPAPAGSDYCFVVSYFGDPELGIITIRAVSVQEQQEKPPDGHDYWMRDFHLSGFRSEQTLQEDFERYLEHLLTHETRIRTCRWWKLRKYELELLEGREWKRIPGGRYWVKWRRTAIPDVSEHHAVYQAPATVPSAP